MTTGANALPARGVVISVSTSSRKSSRSGRVSESPKAMSEPRARAAPTIMALSLPVRAGGGAPATSTTARPGRKLALCARTTSRAMGSPGSDSSSKTKSVSTSPG